MILINKIEIEAFRSIRHASIEGLADFTAFAGLNNSGKSNVLRALNAFFNDETDYGHAIDVISTIFGLTNERKSASESEYHSRSSCLTTFAFAKG